MSFLSSPIEYLKGVGPQRADLLKKDLGIFHFEDLLHHFPYRYLDRTAISPISQLLPGQDFAQVRGRVIKLESVGEKKSKRLNAIFKDATGTMTLTWFQGITGVEKLLVQGGEFFVFGKLSFFNNQPQLVHPEIEAVNEGGVKKNLEPVYPSTEKLKSRGLGGRQIARLTASLLEQLPRLPEFLPQSVITGLRLMSRDMAYRQMHFPDSQANADASMRRLKFEELFLSQLRLTRTRIERQRKSRGVQFGKVGHLFNTFYSEALPFELTNAQKKVIREIRQDTFNGHQMNRLLQGDVGSGKTIVALLAMLLAADNGYQSLMAAPTVILARQHYDSIKSLLGDLPVEVRLLTGSVKSRERKQILSELEEGRVHILVGTHAVIEDPVKFRHLGMAIVDEQHRFGVAQRAKLWSKSDIPPHILVMTATPIPRTLAMTAYGDLDCSVMDELPPGRQPITTVHRLDDQRSRVMGFVKEQIEEGRQIYIIFPLIEESEKLDYENLMSGYEQVKAWFPEPKYWISMVHGRQTPDVKDANMQRFVRGDTQIMVSTTVIEVGVNVPNASVMIIESAEKFGLSQLHQLRGRVGRGADKSFCILMTGPRLGAEAKARLQIMTSTNSGFQIAEKDLEMRGPGDIEGTRQSGMLNFKLADIIKDRPILDAARTLASQLLESDPELEQPDHHSLKNFLDQQKGKTPWSRIS